MKGRARGGGADGSEREVNKDGAGPMAKRAVSRNGRSQVGDSGRVRERSCSGAGAERAGQKLDELSKGDARMTD